MRGPLIPHGHGKPLSKEVHSFDSFDSLSSFASLFSNSRFEELDGLRDELAAIKKVGKQRQKGEVGRVVWPAQHGCFLELPGAL